MTLVQEHRQPLLDEIAVTFTLIGEFRNMLMFSALLTGLLLLCRQWRQAMFAGGTLLVTALANTGTKYFFARVRPEVLSDPLTSLQHAQRPCVGFVCAVSDPGGAGRSRPTAAHAPDLAAGRLHSGAGDCPVAGVSGRALADGHSRRCDARGLRLCGKPVAEPAYRRRSSAMPFKVWWLILPALVAMFSFFVLRHLPHTMLRYAY